MAILRTTLEIVRQQLNDTLRNIDPRPDDWVILSNIMDQAGREFPETRDKVVMVLANMRSETSISGLPQSGPVEAGRVGVVAPPLYVDLFVLFYANFADRNYIEGLTMISRVIAFFQQNPVFTRDNLPDLDPVIDKLRFEFTNLDLGSLNHLMGNLGVKYLPSAYYKVSMIPFQSNLG